MSDKDKEDVGIIEPEVDDVALAREQAEQTSSDEKVITYEDGWTIKSFIGAIFLAMIMLPGGLYLGLVAGAGIGDAAEWVTIVLFAEVARRSFQPLKRQEIYMLYYVAAAVAGGTGPFAGHIWNQYFIQSAPAQGIADQIPTWVVPPAGSEALAMRTFIHRDWLVPIILTVVGSITGRISWMSVGYALFRITSDIERLPFPMAPIAAAGATALAEAGSKEESWRWQVFSTGSVIGMVFGFFYSAIPIVTGTLFGKAITLLPIPFLDLTPSTEAILPTALIGLSLALGAVLAGFVIPYEIVLWSGISCILFQVFGNVLLYKAGFYPNWIPGSNALKTQMQINLDFWMSISIGISMAIAVIGIAMVTKSFMQAKKQHNQSKRSITDVPPGRGDINIWIAIGAWFFTIGGSILMCVIVVPDFPLWIILFFGLLWTPLNSYVSARMIGLTGSGVGFPMLKEAAIIWSGYQKVDIWYAPIPLMDMGGLAQRFREIELTGTKFTSIVKAEFIMMPIILIASFGFWQFFWYTNPIPSAQFPMAQKMWPIQAQMSAIWMQINLPGSEANLIIKNALKPVLMLIGGLGTFLFYWLFIGVFKLPILAFYGFMGGTHGSPWGAIPTLFGALLGRFYFRKRFGATEWPKYGPVLCAGFACGSGLISMLAIAMSLIQKSISYLPF